MLKDGDAGFLLSAGFDIDNGTGYINGKLTFVILSIVAAILEQTVRIPTDFESCFQCLD